LNWRLLWKLKSAPCNHLLMWNILFDKIPTGSNLMKRSFHNPFWCHLCRNEEENTNHIFLHCPTTKAHWNSIICHYPSLKLWQGHDILDAWSTWCQSQNGKSRNMPFLVCWSLWIARNHSIFYHKIPHWPAILLHTIADYDLPPKEDSNAPPHTIIPENIDKSKPWAYFDGST